MALLNYVHPLTGSESHLRVPPRRPMMQGRMAGLLRRCTVTGKRGAGSRSPGPRYAGEDCPWLSTCPGAQGGDRVRWAGTTGKSAGGRRRSASPARTQWPDDPEVTESVGSAGGGAGRLSVCRDAEGREESRGVEFLSLELSEVGQRSMFICLRLRE